MPSAPPTITCVDCGETAHLLSVQGHEDEERIAVYRCSGCWDRWDVVVDAEVVDDEEADDARVGPGAPLREGETD